MKRLCVLALFAVAVYAEPVVPLPNAHAHNDYEHTRPLLDALDHGFCSVEADIYLVEGQLLVAHDREDLKPERTLQKLYLDPLQERARANGGRVYPNGPTILLLIDIKSDGAAAYAALKPVLQNYAEMLSVFANGTIDRKAVMVVLSGYAPRDILAAEPERLAAIDGRLKDLESPIDPSFTPVISDSWAGTFKWNRSGPMPDDIRTNVKLAAEKIHSQGAVLRFWAIPAREDFWAALLDAGVDLINTDDLGRLEAFLVNRPKPASK